MRVQHGASIAASTVWRCLNRHATTYKEMADAAEQEQPDVAARRKARFAAQPELDPERLVFIDETGTLTRIAKPRGCATRSARCRAAIPRGHWKTMTFTGVLRLDDMIAPMVFYA